MINIKKHEKWSLVMNPRYPGYPNTRVFLPHFSPRYPEVNTRVVWVVDFWPNLHVFSIFFTKSSEILCDYSYMIFSKSYNQVQIQNCQKIVSFWGKKILNSNFLTILILNLIIPLWKKSYMNYLIKFLSFWWKMWKKQANLVNNQLPTLPGYLPLGTWD